MLKRYKRGDVVTFRLVKKLQYSNDVINMINDGDGDKNSRIILAIEFYCKYQHLAHVMDHLSSDLINKIMSSEEIENIDVMEESNLNQEKGPDINIKDIEVIKNDNMEVSAEDEIFGKENVITKDENTTKAKPASKLLSSIKRN